MLELTQCLALTGISFVVIWVIITSIGVTTKQINSIVDYHFLFWYLIFAIIFGFSLGYLI